MPKLNYAYQYYKLHLKWNRYCKEKYRKLFIKYNSNPIYYINKINRINKSDLYWMTKIQINVINQINIHKHPNAYQKIIKNQMAIISHFANRTEHKQLLELIHTIEPHTQNQIKQCVIAMYKQALDFEFLKRR